MDCCQSTWKGEDAGNGIAVAAEHCAFTHGVQKHRHLSEDVVRKHNKYVNKALNACKPRICRPCTGTDPVLRQSDKLYDAADKTDLKRWKNC
jgi:hypothetical protein